MDKLKKGILLIFIISIILCSVQAIAAADLNDSGGNDIFDSNDMETVGADSPSLDDSTPVDSPSVGLKSYRVSISDDDDIPCNVLGLSKVSISEDTEVLDAPNSDEPLSADPVANFSASSSQISKKDSITSEKNVNYSTTDDLVDADVSVSQTNIDGAVNTNNKIIVSDNSFESNILETDEVLHAASSSAQANTSTADIVITDSEGNVVNNSADIALNGGLVTIHVSDLAAGDYDITIVYNGVNNYTTATGTVNFRISKPESFVTVEGMDITYGEDETIGVYVPVLNARGTAVVKVNDAIVNTTTFSGEDYPYFTVTLPGLDAGNYKVSVEYSGDPNCYDSSSYDLFKVARIASAVTVDSMDITYGDDETIAVSVPIKNATGNVVVKVNDTVVDNIFFNGEDYPSFDVIVPGLDAGDYNVTAIYTNDSNYNARDASDFFTVAKAASTVIVDGVDIINGDDETISVSVPIINANGTVVVKVDDTIVNDTTFVGRNNPTFHVTVPGLDAGEYNVTAEYSGDPNYSNSNSIGMFTVGRTGSSVSVDSVEFNYDEDETINVSVPDKMIVEL